MEETTTTPQQSTKQPMGVVVVVGLVIVIGVIAVMMLKKPADTTSTDTSATPTQVVGMTQTTAAPSNTTTTTDGVTTINLDAGSFYYSPNEIRVKKGDKVQIVMTSKDMMHDFNIDELGVKMPIVKSGSTGTVEFTADKVGTFEYYCSVGEHREKGQVGKIIVE